LNSYADVALGVRGGLNLTQYRHAQERVVVPSVAEGFWPVKTVNGFWPDAATERRVLPGFYGSALLRVPLHRYFSLQTELGVSFQGEQHRFENTLYKYHRTIRTIYATVPLQGVLMYRGESRWKPYVSGGPVASVLLKATDEVVIRPQDKLFSYAPNDSAVLNIRPHLMPYDIALCAAVGTDVYYGYQDISIELRYTHGMMATVRDGYLGRQGAYRRSGLMRNATVGLIMGLVFRTQ
jgi:hypothetical protein